MLPKLGMLWDDPQEHGLAQGVQQAGIRPLSVGTCRVPSSFPTLLGGVGVSGGSVPPGRSRGAGSAPCGQARVPLAVLGSFAGAACPGRLPACSQPEWKGTGKGREGTGFRESERSSLKQVISWSALAHPDIPGKSLSVFQLGSKLVSFVVVWTLSETYLTAVFN